MLKFLLAGGLSFHYLSDWKTAKLFNFDEVLQLQNVFQYSAIWWNIFQKDDNWGS